MDTQNRTLTNGAIGAVITFIIFFVPGLGFISPVLGGGVSGYLQDDGISGGAVVGVVMALISGVPAFLLGFSGLFLGTIPLLSDSVIAGIIGGMGAVGGMVVIFFWFVWTIYSLILGLIGGVIGGAVAN